MPGSIAHTKLTCSHGGSVPTAVPNPRVTVNGQPSLLFTSPCVIAGCAFPPPPNGNGPCVSAPALCSTRVMSGGFPLVISLNPVVCVPTGTPLITLFSPRVIAM